MSQENFDFDVIVIGSGFGGSVMTCRLTEKGHRVCLLERGRRYGMHEFPRRMDEVRNRLFWDPKSGTTGFMEFRVYPESDIYSVSASGLGGGSLIYANVLMRMPADFFQGWPGGISRDMLDPLYDRVQGMMEAAQYPFSPDNPYYYDTAKTHAFKQAAETIAAAPDEEKRQYLFPHLAVRFAGDFPGHQTPNAQGVIQSRCNKCGECDIGCNIHAKNTLDLNYLARAETHGAEIRTQAWVQEILPLETEGYRVTYVNPDDKSQETSITARRVVVSAGSIGSTGLLLRMKKAGKLPKISDRLGQRWCPNGDLEGTVLMAKDQLNPTDGPVITSAIEYRFKSYPDGFPHGMVLQDAGFPSFVAWYLVGKLPSPLWWLRAWSFTKSIIGSVLRRTAGWLRLYRFRREINIGDEVAGLIDKDDYVRRTFILLGMGRDRSDGRIDLRDDGEPVIHWRKKASNLHYDRVRGEMKKVAGAMGGTFMDNPLTYLDKVIAVHPLGGCTMAEGPEQGVVNTKGEVFGHPGLYVVDASILPTSVGPNPSLTIAALAEHMAEQFE